MDPQAGTCGDKHGLGRHAQAFSEMSLALVARFFLTTFPTNMPLVLQKVKTEAYQNNLPIVEGSGARSHQIC